MARDRRFPRPLIDRPPAPFSSGEAAWLWFCLCQAARDEGARFIADAGETARPCDPDDIYRAAAALHRRGSLHAAHLRVMGRYGRAASPPDSRLPEQRSDSRLWSQAMDHLGEALRLKGIVAPLLPPSFRPTRCADVS